CDVGTVTDLRSAVGDEPFISPFSSDLAGSWLALPSQSSGITWLHLLSLAGSPHFEVDFAVTSYLAEVADPGADLTVDYVLGEIAAAAHALDAEVEVIERIVWQASHGRILSRMRDEGLLPAAGPIVGPEATGLVWEMPEDGQGARGPAPF